MRHTLGVCDPGSMHPDHRLIICRTIQTLELIKTQHSDLTSDLEKTIGILSCSEKLARIEMTLLTGLKTLSHAKTMLIIISIII